MTPLQHKYLQLKKGAQAAMVQRTCNILWYEYGVGTPRRITHTDVLAYMLSRRSEAELLTWPGIGKATIKLLKAWLVIHKRELRHG
jgi:hypothetical protein